MSGAKQTDSFLLRFLRFKIYLCTCLFLNVKLLNEVDKN